MPIDQVQTAVQTFLAANWTATDVCYENDGFEPRNDAASGDLLPWMLVEIQGGLYEQRSIGAGTASADYWQDSGTLWAHIFVGANTGSVLAKQFGAQLAELFRGRMLDPNITFGDISLAASGGSADGNDWSFSASIDWVQG